ncbi:MAG: hypothetical protein KGK33_04985 [Hyphomicrobiales bacterium]|jgi:hypothetical protein|nr:hypothetical protein [Hyphomicrobiales bacterium]MDE2283953.1 hypothetical protein [Hyphomicrobiales bacterium]
MTVLSKALLAAAAAAGMLASLTLNASAEIVCSGGACWHTHARYDYPPSAGVVIHPDSWHWGAGEHYSWREHEGRGYWRGNRWMEW